MKRLIESELETWKVNPGRKPLLIRGARQVGKTYTVREFGKQFSNFVEINFEFLKDAKKVFDADLNPERLIRDLSFIGCGIQCRLQTEASASVWYDGFCFYEAYYGCRYSPGGTSQHRRGIQQRKWSCPKSI